jgi:hypothetical protein
VDSGVGRETHLRRITAQIASQLPRDAAQVVRHGLLRMQVAGVGQRAALPPRPRPHSVAPAGSRRVGVAEGGGRVGDVVGIEREDVAQLTPQTPVPSNTD